MQKKLLWQAFPEQRKSPIYDPVLISQTSCKYFMMPLHLLDLAECMTREPDSASIMQLGSLLCDQTPSTSHKTTVLPGISNAHTIWLTLTSVWYLVIHTTLNGWILLLHPPGVKFLRIMLGKSEAECIWLTYTHCKFKRALIYICPNSCARDNFIPYIFSPFKYSGAFITLFFNAMTVVNTM